MAGGVHKAEKPPSAVNWEEKYMERLASDMNELRGMEARLTNQIAEVNSNMNNRMNILIDSFTVKIDNNTKHMNNLVITMVIGICVAVVASVIALMSK